jgi:aryl-alcohol dehydrogenase-like predicted oxidoreductase
MTKTSRAGTFRLGDREVNRMGYGAMRLSGPGIFGPPKDRAQATAVLREAVASGVNHIDTSDYYGPHVVNEIIREALSPYPDDLVLVAKLGARRGDDASWLPWNKPDELAQGLRDNLNNLGVDAMEIVNLRIMGAVDSPTEKPIADQVEAMAELQRQGLVRHLGLSNVTRRQIEEAQAITPVVCVQNHYNLVHRDDDELIDWLAEQGIAYVPFFPLGGFSPLQSDDLAAIAAELDATPMQVALAWLLQRSSNILLIPGTSSVVHLRENLAAAELELPKGVLDRLERLGQGVPA